MNALKDTRAEKLTQLNSEVTQAERIKRVANPSARTVTRRLQNLRAAYSDYINSHTRYAARLVDDDIFFATQTDHIAITEKYDKTIDDVEEMEERILMTNNPANDAAAQVTKDDALQRVEAAKVEIAQRLRDFLTMVETNERPSCHLLKRLENQLSSLRNDLVNLLNSEFAAMRVTANNAVDRATIDGLRLTAVLGLHKDVDVVLNVILNDIEPEAINQVEASAVPVNRPHDAGNNSAYKS